VRTRSMATRASTSGERGGSAGGARATGGGAESRAQPADTVRPRLTSPSLRSQVPRPAQSAAPSCRHLCESSGTTHAALGRRPPTARPASASAACCGGMGARRRAGHDGQRNGRRTCEAGLRPWRQPRRGRLPRRVAPAPGRLPVGLPYPDSKLTLNPSGHLLGGPPGPARLPSAHRQGACTYFPVWRPGRPYWCSCLCSRGRAAAQPAHKGFCGAGLARPASPDRSHSNTPHGALAACGDRLMAVSCQACGSAPEKCPGPAAHAPAPAIGQRRGAGRVSWRAPPRAGGLRADVDAAGRQPVRAGGHARAPHRCA